MKLNLIALTLIASLAAPAFQSHAQMVAAPIPIATKPGTYTLVDRAKIETAKIDWSRVAQREDAEAYKQAADEAYKAYQDLYSAFQKLRQINIDTVLAKKGKAKVSIEVLSGAIMDYVQKRDLFVQKIAAVEVTQDVFAGLEKQDKLRSEEKLIYQKGSLNLKAFGKTYKEAVAKMDDQAGKLTYRYGNNMKVVTTEAGMGLEIPQAEETPESLAAMNEEFQKNAKITDEDMRTIGLMSNEVGRHMINFTDANKLHFYWFNHNQTEDGKKWVASIQTKARVLNWVRAFYCMPLGVPSLDIPQPKSFNLGYLSRGVKSSQFRIAQGFETEEPNIRQMLTRFDELFVSIQSQSGEFDNEAGFMGFLNRVNSKLTWHNEVAAFMSIMKILRDNMNDELDLREDPVAGCEQVRARYYAKYGSLKDPVFVKTVSAYLEGMNFGGSGDNLAEIFQDAGKIITAKGGYMVKLRKLQKEHPGSTLLGKSILENDDVK